MAILCARNRRLATKGETRAGGGSSPSTTPNHFTGAEGGAPMFDAEAASFVCDFIEYLTCSNGAPFRLMDW